MNNQYLKDKYLKNKIIEKKESIVFLEKSLQNKMKYIIEDILIKNEIKTSTIFYFIIKDYLPYLIDMSNNEIINIKTKYKFKTEKVSINNLSIFEFNKYIIKDIKNQKIYKSFKEINKLKKIKLKNYIYQEKIKSGIYKIYYTLKEDLIVFDSINYIKNKKEYIVKNG
jgi:hypothetical protein